MEVQMKSETMKMICRFLIVALMMLPFQAVQASMIGTDHAAAAASAQVDRDAVLNLISRTEVAGQLQSMGLDPQTALDRVGAMTDQEVHALAGRVETEPAGAKTKSGWVWAAVIIIAVVIYFNYK
jgi:folylpolyglutamate synthase/dihydropteroate synthase